MNVYFGMVGELPQTNNQIQQLIRHIDLEQSKNQIDGNSFCDKSMNYIQILPEYYSEDLHRKYFQFSQLIYKFSSESLGNYVCFSDDNYLNFLQNGKLDIEETVNKFHTIFNSANTLNILNENSEKLEKLFKKYEKKKFSEYHLERIVNSNGNEIDEEFPKMSLGKSVCLGGTFDHLHCGHKLLLNYSSYLCDNGNASKLFCGIPESRCLKTKKLYQFIQTTTQRIENCKKFVSLTYPSIGQHIVGMTDIYGPSIQIDELDYLVVTEETVKNGNKVIEKRKELLKNSPKLLSIQLLHKNQIISPNYSDSNARLSSTNRRKSLLGKLLRPVEKTPNTYRNLYIIGLTGPIASGKSSIADKMKQSYLNNSENDFDDGKLKDFFELETLNCDQIGHDVYRKGTKVYNELRKVNFGVQIIDEESGEIDRRKLGSVVFADEKLMTILEEIVWEGILEELNRKFMKFNKSAFEKKKKIIVIVEAAVLFRAGWQKFVNEIWLAIIGEEEAKNRLMKRNHLNSKEAENRLAKHFYDKDDYIDNWNYYLLEHAHVALTTLWESSVTQNQVDGAINLLYERTK